MAISMSRHKSEAKAQAEDPATPIADLVGLALHRDPNVRASVAARPDCPLATMLTLWQQGDIKVLESLVSNPRVPRQVLEHLAEHKRGSIRHVALERLEDQAPR